MSNQKFDSPQEALAHYGVKGMKWGIRRSAAELAKDRGERVSRKTNRHAKKDAKEFERARLFYGEGAGTRRKLIRASVEAKASKDESYKQAFDRHLAAQDSSKHAAKARSERRRKDVVGKTGKTARGVHRSLTGGFGSVSLASAVIAAGYMYSKNTGLDSFVTDTVKTKYSDVKQKRSNTKAAEDLLRDMGIKR